MNDPLRIGLMGAGEWGPNLLRAFLGRKDCRVLWVCDNDPRRLDWLRPRFPGVEALGDEGFALSRADTDAVAICTPTESHFRLCHAALTAGKHVFVEKPMACSYTEARQLVDLAVDTDRKLMVGHVFLFHPGIRSVKQLLDEGTLGRPLYFSSVRSHFGPVREDVSVLWDLAPHDLAVLRFLIPEFPKSARATGFSLGPGLRPDSAFAELRWGSGLVAQMQMSWLESRKVRRTTLIGTRRAVVFEEEGGEVSVRLFEPNGTVKGSAQGLMSYREALRGPGEKVPLGDWVEPVGIECGAFVDWVSREVPQFSCGTLGAEVVYLLEGLERSLEARGAAVPLYGGGLFGGVTGGLD
jgi:predicted dehydrogenase